MDIMSVIGVIGAAALLIYAMISGGELSHFFNLNSIALTVGGTFAALMVTFPLKVFAALPKLMVKIFAPHEFNPQNNIADIVEAAYIVRKGGISALEDMIPAYKDDLMRKGFALAAESADPETIRGILENEIGAMKERHKTGAQFFEKGAVLASGFGMLGTIVGLISVLSHANNPGNITSEMAAALTAAFYGLILANVIFLPMGNKLRKRSDEEVLCKQIISDGIVAIAAGENPKQIHEKLMAYIPLSMRTE